jgi:hypothetical protein
MAEPNPHPAKTLLGFKMTWAFIYRHKSLTAIIEPIDDAVTAQLSIVMASLSQTFDTTRAEIVAAMEARIEKGDRTQREQSSQATV